jgi:hypothetical protein
MQSHASTSHSAPASYGAHPSSGFPGGLQGSAPGYGLGSSEFVMSHLTAAPAPTGFLGQHPGHQGHRTDHRQGPRPDHRQGHSRPSHGHRQSQGHRHGNGGGHRQAVPDRPLRTVLVPVPPDVAGFVIGSGGSTIKGVKTRTLTSIKMFESDPQNNRPYPYFSIRGSSQENVLNAVLSVHNLMIEGIRRNTLGGSDSTSAVPDAPQSPNYTPSSPSYSPSTPTFYPSMVSSGGDDDKGSTLAPVTKTLKFKAGN